MNSEDKPQTTVGDMIEAYGAKLQLDTVSTRCQELGRQHATRYLNLARASQVPMNFGVAADNLITQRARTAASRGENLPNFQDIARQMLNHDFGDDNEAAYAIAYGSAISTSKMHLIARTQQNQISDLIQKSGGNPPSDPRVALQIIEAVEETDRLTNETLLLVEKKTGLAVFYENMVTTPPRVTGVADLVKALGYQAKGGVQVNEQKLETIRQVVETRVADKSVQARITLQAQPQRI